ncbi:unnamed protein product [Meganyctiphanes norvegica]|uniref:Uncharacterized protein n=1 Tax=Meganyctiphanes norvegica TaxID=48144 RepID=A0AAV2SPL8_MEGNR
MPFLDGCCCCPGLKSETSLIAVFKSFFSLICGLYISFSIKPLIKFTQDQISAMRETHDFVPTSDESQFILSVAKSKISFIIIYCILMFIVATTLYVGNFKDANSLMIPFIVMGFLVSAGIVIERVLDVWGCRQLCSVIRFPWSLCVCAFIEHFYTTLVVVSRYQELNSKRCKHCRYLPRNVYITDVKAQKISKSMNNNDNTKVKWTIKWPTPVVTPKYV